MAAPYFWYSLSNTVTSVRPVSSSSDRKTTVRPLLVGGRCGRTTRPAALTSCPGLAWAISDAVSAPHLAREER